MTVSVELSCVYTKTSVQPSYLAQGTGALASLTHTPHLQHSQAPAPQRIQLLRLYPSMHVYAAPCLQRRQRPCTLRHIRWAHAGNGCL